MLEPALKDASQFMGHAGDAANPSLILLGTKRLAYRNPSRPGSTPIGKSDKAEASPSFLCDGPDGGLQIKILDFGIARVRDKKTRLTANGALIGTPAYMSPEQAQGQDADERADLCAFGVILFEMLAGRVPFKLATVAMVLSAQIFDTPPGLREVEPAAPDVPNIRAADPPAAGRRTATSGRRPRPRR